MNEREAARHRLERAVNMLGDEASLKVQMQRDPVKIIGGATGVGVVLGALLGSQLRRTRKVYVDAYSPAKQQKALIGAQNRANRQGNIGNKLMGLAITFGIKYLQEQVLTPRLEGMAGKLESRSADRSARPARPAVSEVSVSEPVQAPADRAQAVTPNPAVPALPRDEQVVSRQEVSLSELQASGASVVAGSVPGDRAAEAGELHTDKPRG